MVKPLTIVAVGGDALIRDERRNSTPDQYVAVMESVQHAVDMIETRWDLVPTHDNGLQVGFILRRSELAGNEVFLAPLNYAMGNTQGVIGYIFQKALHNELARRGINKPVIALVTQTQVNPHDDTSASPSKLIGTSPGEATAQQHQQQLG